MNEYAQLWKLLFPMLALDDIRIALHPPKSDYGEPSMIVSNGNGPQESYVISAEDEETE
jgi:hypothetical protein